MPNQTPHHIGPSKSDGRKSAARPDRAQELRALIAVALEDLVRSVSRAAAMRNDRTPGGPGFLTPFDPAIRDKAARDEKAARHELAIRGLEIPGESQAPLNIGAVSIEAEARDYLVEVIAGLHAELHRSGVCWVGNPGHWRGEQRWLDQTVVVRFGRDTKVVHIGTLGQAAGYLRDLVAIVKRPSRLEPIHRGIEDLITRARRVVDGEDRARHPNPCAHCGRMSLVVYLKAGVIRCEADPVTGTREPCTCDDRYCPCQTSETRYRHEWHRAHRGITTPSWRKLESDQAARRRHEENEMTAQAAIERIRTLHQPSTDHDEDADPYCVGCWEAGGYDGAPTWPCPTIVVIDEPTTDEEGESS